MKKSLFRVLIVLISALLLTATLFACTVTDKDSKFTGLSVLKGGVAVSEIKFTDGERIKYNEYSVLVSVSDGTTFIEPLTEAMFLPGEISTLYALSSGNTKTMTIFYQKDGKSFQTIIPVKVISKNVEVKTYDLSFVMTGDYSNYAFDTIPGITRVTSLPDTHAQLQTYQKITWYRNPTDISTKIELPYEMKENLSLYGVVHDDRQYTIRFWKDKVGTNYQNQVGGDVSAVRYGTQITVPTAGLEKAGYEFFGWVKDGAALDVSGEIGKKYYIVNDECTTYPTVQVINIHAAYTEKTYKVSFFYMDKAGVLQDLDMQSSQYAFIVKHGCTLSLGATFNLSADTATLTIPAPPEKLGAGYRGAWYIADTVFGDNQTRSIQQNISIVAKYTVKKLNVQFFRHNGNELSNLSVDYGTTIDDNAYPVLSTEIGYSFSWDKIEDLKQPILNHLIVREVRTPNEYQYVFYYDTSQGKVLLNGNANFNSQFSLWDDATIRATLGLENKAYYDYSWFGTETADPNRDTPLSGYQTQAANTMNFYLKFKDARKYTVNFFTQQGVDGTVSTKVVQTIVVGFAGTASFSGNPISGWKATDLYKKTDSTTRLSDTLSFTPSLILTGEDRAYAIDVVVRYERENYKIQLFEPNFGTTEQRLYAAATAPYETVLSTLAEIVAYITTDRVQGEGATYRFYGWANASGDLVNIGTENVKGNIDLYARWVTLEEGSLGIKYAIRNDIGSEYAEAISYDGTATELIIGAKYIVGSNEYAVLSVAVIQCPSKNNTVTKITIPKSVAQIAPGAFVNFYKISEFEVAANSTSYKTTDGVLYSQDGASLVAYPIKKMGAFTVPATVTAIGASAFMGYTESELTFTTDSNLDLIGAGAFANSSTLNNVVLPSSLVSLGAGAFAGCTQLSGVSYGGTTLRNVGEEAFKETPFIKNVQNGLLMLGTVVLRAVGTVAENFVLEDSVTIIAAGAFKGSNIKTFTIGASSALQYIGDGAFESCATLSQLKINATGDDVIEFGEGVFLQGSINFEILISTEAQLEKYLLAYKDTDYEEDFKLL